MELELLTAKRIYKESPDWFKEKLVEEFGEESFKENDFESIKTFEDACNATGTDQSKLFNEADTSDEIAYKKLKVIRNAIVKGWNPNWNDSDQYKWYPYFRLSSGFGFSHADCRYGHSFSLVGSRLCFETEDQAIYAGNQFESLYKDLLTISE